MEKVAQTNHLEHEPGDAVEVDWLGPAMEYVDTATGEAVKADLFAAPCHTASIPLKN